MKYFENPKEKKDNKVSSYLVIIGSLVAVGAVAWLALALGGTGDGAPKTQSPTPNPDMSYSEPDSSYNDNTPEISSPPSEETSKETPSEPYTPPVAEEEVTPDPEPEQALIMPLSGAIIKDFSNTALQFSATYNDLRLHAAVDIECKKGTAVAACGDGTVKSVEQGTALGNTVTIEHKNGIIFKYCGLDKITVSEGRTVKMGESIGTVGTLPSECADKEHLHLEAYSKGTAVNPMDIIGKLD